jgi:predicted nucleic acid-binding Zn ribbon protein
MEAIRDLLRSTLAAALNGLSPEDRVHAGWPVVCGGAIALRTRVIAFTDGVLEVAVADGAWLRQMGSLREKLLREMPGVCGVPLTDILFRVRPAEFEADTKRQEK